MVQYIRVFEKYEEIVTSGTMEDDVAIAKIKNALIEEKERLRTINRPLEVKCEKPIQCQCQWKKKEILTS